MQIADVLGRLTPPIRSVWVCLDGALWAEHDDASRQLDAARLADVSPKMGGSSEIADLSRTLRDVERRMREAEVEFRFRGISSYKRDAIIAAHPTKDGRGWDTTAGAHELLAASAVDPAMTEAEARQLVQQAHHGVTAKLFNCAWMATEGSADVPFSARASG